MKEEFRRMSVAWGLNLLLLLKITYCLEEDIEPLRHDMRDLVVVVDRFHGCMY